jgi:hypothetical protein
MDAETLEQLDQELTEMPRRDFQGESMAVPERIFAMVAWRA